jgi:hypothetical protein
MSWHAAEVIVDTTGKRLLFSTVRIANLTTSGIPTTGTAFNLTVPLDDGGFSPLLVTNKHVVANAAKLSAHFIARKADANEPDLGRGAEVALDPADWIGHPDPEVDVAVVPIARVVQQHGHLLYAEPLPLSLLSTEIADYYVDAIEEITFIGYPNGHYDEKHLTPFVRRGITATPMELDFSGKPTFLVDGSVFGGSSGSPVFLFNEGSYRGANNSLVVGSRLRLVGIIAATMLREARLPVEVANAEHVKIAQELNLGLAFNARAIKETVESALASAGLRLAVSAVPGGTSESVPTPATPTS